MRPPVVRIPLTGITRFHEKSTTRFWAISVNFSKCQIGKDKKEGLPVSLRNPDEQTQFQLRFECPIRIREPFAPIGKTHFVAPR